MMNYHAECVYVLQMMCAHNAGQKKTLFMQSAMNIKVEREAFAVCVSCLQLMLNDNEMKTRHSTFFLYHSPPFLVLSLQSFQSVSSADVWWCFVVATEAFVALINATNWLQVFHDNKKMECVHTKRNSIQFFAFCIFHIAVSITHRFLLYLFHGN